MPAAAARTADDGRSPMLPPTSVMRGCRSLVSRITQRYQARQLEGPSFVIHLLGMQPVRRSGTTTQPSRHASSRTVGSHIIACESPMRTIIFRLVVSPTRQILLVVCELSPREMQPSGSTYCGGLLLSLPIGGLRPEGMGSPRRAAATAATTSGSAGAGTSDGEAVGPLNRCSSRAIALSESTAVTTTAAAATPTMAPVAARLRALRRIGFSTSAYDTHDSRNAPTSRPSLTVSGGS